MFPDYFNPIFVLKAQRVITFIQRNWIFVLSCYVFVLFVQIVSWSSHSGYYSHLASVWIGILITIIPAVIPGVELAWRRINDDLSLFTPLTPRQIINGYVLTGIFYSCSLIALVKIPVPILLLLGDSISVNEVGLSLQSVLWSMLYSIYLNLLVLSFMAGVKTTLALGITGALIFLFYQFLFPLGGIIGIWAHFKYLKPDSLEILTWAYMAISFLCFALPGYFLAIWNYTEKTSYAWKHCLIVLSYACPLMAVYVFFVLFLTFFQYLL